ncbi:MULTISPECIES: SURF1 family protein [Methylobacterium]|uniref:SURF1-like protein n=1 Tax=Methylobacterium jeotgali TaxID=381630 RepID=A0ABQ4SYU8_9HYPH|nr:MULTISPECIES: SURF1 family protein [Methylobacterium]PIU05142.1 MAG: surfeit 1 [Methylobacterium sp. CG09_land_8_20_14_0_10_71_15]PIU12856.1 MAG: surfeit 1 [Methylobacterium sp. CG08_land_8_20_14_0_20_71_15]GBU17554.1 SURF1-like protein [Methylobacterium sp.]GJE07098.1 hypothetical protein AOPFMNJM_2422 [Methylobacterium jeotgali]
MSPEPAARRGAFRTLAAPGIATLVCLAILLGLGTWQLTRKGEKEALIARIVERSRAAPEAPPAPAEWQPARDEFRHVAVAGRFDNGAETLVHGLAPGTVPGRARQGFYVITPFKRDDGSVVLVNRGFVPTELKRREDRADGLVEGETTVTGLLRASETRGAFVPESDPVKGEWFTRDVPAIAAARGLGAVAPYLIEADAAKAPGVPATAWPQGGQLRVDLPNNHMQYAFTWFGIAACLIGVFAVFAWGRLRAR